jgi:drug/metabolite transporter (DMT)-like permease
MTVRSGGEVKSDSDMRMPAWALWSAFIALSTATQLAFKWAGTKLEAVPYGIGWALVAVTTPAVYVAVAGYIALFALWVLILQRTDLTRAFAMTGLIYITVPALGWVLFAERFGIERVLGIACIIAGVMLMGRGGRH